MRQVLPNPGFWGTLIRHVSGHKKRHPNNFCPFTLPSLAKSHLCSCLSPPCKKRMPYLQGKRTWKQDFSWRWQWNKEGSPTLPEPEPEQSFDRQDSSAGRHPPSRKRKICMFPTFWRPKTLQLGRVPPRRCQLDHCVIMSAWPLCHHQAPVILETAMKERKDSSTLVFMATSKSRSPRLKRLQRSPMTLTWPRSMPWC